MSMDLLCLPAFCGSSNQGNLGVSTNLKTGQSENITGDSIRRGKFANMFIVNDRTRHEGRKPDKFSYLNDLKVCSNMGAIKRGRNIHKQLSESEHKSDIAVGTALVDMYAKCGSLIDACSVFDTLLYPNVVSWGVMLAGYAQHGKGELAVQCFENMQHHGIRSDKITFLSILKACGSTGAREQGVWFHAQIFTKRLQFEIVVGNTLMDMYIKCGSMDEACRIFDNLPYRTLVSWNVMILGHALVGECHLALKCFENMQLRGIKADKVTFLSILKACGSIGSLQRGRYIHEQTVERELQFDFSVGSTIIDMYVKCGSLLEAHEVFYKLPNQNVVSWNTMIAGYAQHNKGFLALECFKLMRSQDVVPSQVTFLNILKALSSMGTDSIHQGRCIHEQILSYGHQSDHVVGNTIVDMYIKCGSLEEAENVFNKLSTRSIVSWTVMISGYAQFKNDCLALECFQIMQCEGIKPNKISFLSLLKACSSSAAIYQGRCLHEHIIFSRLQCDIIVASSVMDMYIKCGRWEEGLEMFKTLPNQDVVAWGAIIAGYAVFGKTSLAAECFKEMQDNGIKPDSTAFVNILTALCHAGLVDEGLWYFQSLREETRVLLNTLHFACMVDLLGRAGCFQDALDLFKG